MQDEDDDHWFPPCGPLCFNRKEHKNNSQFESTLMLETTVPPSLDSKSSHDVEVVPISSFYVSSESRVGQSSGVTVCIGYPLCSIYITTHTIEKMRRKW
jgi:hypothetical protein